MAKRKPIKRTINRTKTSPVLNPSDIPATQGMLITLQKQFISNIKSLDKKVESRFNQMESKFSQIESRFNQMESKFSQIDARFNQVDSNIAKVLSEVHRIALLVEEQNKRNQFVLDGYEQIYKRQDRHEKEIDNRLKNIENMILKNSQQP